MNYQTQILDFEFLIKGNGEDPSEITDTIKLKAPRSTATISTFGGVNSSEASFTIWGLGRDDIATLTRFEMWNGGKNYNAISVKANGVKCYEGTIINCVADFNQAPDIPVIINCQPCAFLSVAVAMPFSFGGEIKASDIIQSIIKPFGMTLTNIDVTESLKNPYIIGSPYQQILSVANDIRCFIELSYSDIYISKIGTARDEEAILISPQTGLIGYPSYFGTYLTVKTYFNPSYKTGQKVKLETYLPLASGDYTVGAIIHNLSCQLPGGTFESSLILYKVFT
ncbi:hypothetical protein DES39_0563 [Orbus hercynius]|uniref:Uncharacterized protein n=1 Tax=Orbus hercynius TaxID=593135 RepID=A0A495RII2_9GAMM|nr:hypothetical protein [Orbus hercynius]RKS87342.1 hypothetical protein DES39_0563 [Orbus hercynius]